MAKYKYIYDGSSPFYTKGSTYDENYTSPDALFSVDSHRRDSPYKWQLVEDNFELPEKWYIEVTHENSDIIIKWREKKGFVTFPKTPPRYIDEEGFLYRYPPAGTRISFNEFKKYVLGMEDKKIVGYRLTKQEFKKAASMIMFGNPSGVSDLEKHSCLKSKYYLNKLKEVGVLDIWFEPVYEEEHKLPIINGYEGKVIKKAGYGDGILEYGCARISTRLIHDIYFNNNRTKQSEDFNRKVASITLDSGVTITWEQIQQIVEYLNNK